MFEIMEFFLQELHIAAGQLVLFVLTLQNHIHSLVFAAHTHFFPLVLLGEEHDQAAEIHQGPDVEDGAVSGGKWAVLDDKA